MMNDSQGGDHHVDKLDADAVCVECATVNAEGTLLCKVCGNNLRDQRSRRLMSDQALDTGPVAPPLKKWLSPVLFVLAVALILSTLYNQDMIVEWMMSAQISDQRGPELLWEGEAGDRFDGLLSDLQERMPSEAEVIAARSNPLAGGGMSGVYAFFEDEVFLGVANVLEDGETLYFVAILESGDRLRGMATLQGGVYIMDPKSGGIELRDGITPIQGVASPQGRGIIECVGDDRRTRYNCVAYRLGG